MSYWFSNMPLLLSLYSIIIIMKQALPSRQRNAAAISDVLHLILTIFERETYL